MTTQSETNLQSLRINRLTQTQLENATSLSNVEFYMVDPEFTGGKLLATDATGDIIESNVNAEGITTRAIIRTWEG